MLLCIRFIFARDAFLSFLSVIVFGKGSPYRGLCTYCYQSIKFNCRVTIKNNLALYGYQLMNLIAIDVDASLVAYKQDIVKPPLIYHNSFILNQWKLNTLTPKNAQFFYLKF